MFFYGIHTQILPRIDSQFVGDNPNNKSKKFMITFMAGSLLYIILMSLLNFMGESGNDNFISYTFRNYYTWFFLIDAISLGIHYKVFYRNRDVEEPGIELYPPSQDKTFIVPPDDESDIDEIAAMSDTEL